MKDFGFAIHKSSGIDLDKADKRFFLRVAAKEPEVLQCIACGSCSAGCTVNPFSEVNFRKIILSLERGEVKQAVEAAKRCMLCGKCILVCPRGINTRNILREIINNG